MELSQADAVEIARRRVVYDGVLSLTARITEVEERVDEWRVRFFSPRMRGGESYVFINKSDGVITRIFYTQ